MSHTQSFTDNLRVDRLVLDRRHKSMPGVNEAKRVRPDQKLPTNSSFSVLYLELSFMLRNQASRLQEGGGVCV